MDLNAALSRLTTRPVTGLSPEAVVAAFTAGFAGYQVPIAMTAAQLDVRLRGENLDPFASTIDYAGDEPVAIVLVARRGTLARVAAMGVAPSMRGTGLAAAVLARAVSQARARSDTALVLEVIRDNVRAVTLYERAGFAVVRSLWGFTLEPAPSDAVPATEIDPAAAVVLAGCFGMADLAWQQQLASLAAMVRPTRCFTDARHGLVAMVDASQETVRLKALCFDAGLTDAGAVAFTASLRAVFPDHAWTAPPLFTDAHRARFFEPAGWASMDLRQFEMRHPLDAS